jgi:hypothetical protein
MPARLITEESDRTLVLRAGGLFVSGFANLSFPHNPVIRPAW